MGFQQVHEVGTKENRERGVGRRPCLCASHRVVEQRQVAEAIARVEKTTDAELVTVLAALGISLDKNFTSKNNRPMKIANGVNYGLTAGFYGSSKEVEWFFDNIEAGVTYANRPQGATTGAWPGFQPFGGWKGSGATGKNGGGYYYVQLYMHEQIRTLIKPAKANGKATSKARSKTTASKKPPRVSRAAKKKSRK